MFGNGTRTKYICPDCGAVGSNVDFLRKGHDCMKRQNSMAIYTVLESFQKRMEKIMKADVIMLDTPSLAARICRQCGNADCRISEIDFCVRRDL